jgi:hypothetical protein
LTITWFTCLALSSFERTKFSSIKYRSGDDGEKVTPVPIPNTEVKLLSADGSEGFPFARVGRCQANKTATFVAVFICQKISCFDPPHLL